uniref:Uncharacterized protein LOC111100116 n=1 Tax=Crassostrea virginica TaxID=6565 RepID=A0A8B8ABY1_CRAVI|nr:uncharacterized protein LOC111100116 [Crassostrea virginica]
MRKVNICPRNPTELERASEFLGCSSDEYGNNQYMCLPNEEKTSLFEFCYGGLMGMKEKGYCLGVSEGKLTTHSCKDFLFGCPNEPWKSHEFYKYPACQAINIRDKCYRLDPSCPTGYDKNNETILEVSEIRDPNVVIYSILGAMIVLLVTIILFLLWERNKLKKDYRDRNGKHENAQLMQHREDGVSENNESDHISKHEEDFGGIHVDGSQSFREKIIVRSRKRNDTETSVESFVQDDGDELVSSASKAR